MMKLITSEKLLNGFNLRLRGALDCNPTLATISGCVAMVARDFEIAPSTIKKVRNQISSLV